MSKTNKLAMSPRHVPLVMSSSPESADYSEMGNGACLTMNNIGKSCQGGRKLHVRFDERGQAEWPALYSIHFSQLGGDQQWQK